MSAAPLRIIVTTGPGEKSGIDKMTVAIEGVGAQMVCPATPGATWGLSGIVTSVAVIVSAPV